MVAMSEMRTEVTTENLSVVQKGKRLDHWMVEQMAGQKVHHWVDERVHLKD